MSLCVALTAMGFEQPQGEPMGGPRRGQRDRQGADPERRREIRDRILERREKGEGPPKVPDEMINWALEAMKTKLPRLHERLTTLRQSNPELFQNAFRKLMPFLKEYRGLMEHRPDLAETVLQEFQAEERLRELSKEFGLAKDDAAKQAPMLQEVETLVRKQMELREKRFQARLEEFEDRIKDQQLQLQMMKDQLQTMNARKDDFVSRRVSQVKNGRMAEGMPGFGGPGMNGQGPFGGPRGPDGDRPGRPGDRRPPGDGPPPGEDDRPPPRDDGPPPDDSE
ncbi:MAG: hypothetical protein AABZ08_13560 [Planctomycetota bacterium]